MAHRPYGWPANFPVYDPVAPGAQPSVPADYDPNQGFRNPTGSVPASSDIRGFWQQSPIGIAPLWSDPTVLANILPNIPYGELNGVVARAVWGTTVFDLYPQLQGATSQGQPAATWIGSGPNARLSVQIHGLVSVPASLGMQIYTLEASHPTDPNLGGTIQSGRFAAVGYRENITAHVFDGQGISIATAGGTGGLGIRSAQLQWEPPAGARYWRVWVIFDTYDATFAEAQAINLSLEALCV